jgi:hypothetical protein
MVYMVYKCVYYCATHLHLVVELPLGLPGPVVVQHVCVGHHGDGEEQGVGWYNMYKRHICCM